MDERWQFAFRHGTKSVLGFVRVLVQRPTFAFRLASARLEYFRTRKFTGKIVTPESFIIDTKDSLIAYWSMFIERELHDRSWVSALAKHSRPLVVDVGANAAVFSHYAHCLNHNAEIVAFEPLPAMAERVRALKTRTGADLTCYEEAVSRAPGEAWFHSPLGVDGTSKFASGNETGNKFKVKVTTLDEKLAGREITVMKIDVEGFELDVIAGGPKTLAMTDFVVIESEDPDHLSKITSALGPDWRRSRLAHTDYLFTRIVR
jgi:FkbM family methyltransferase